MLDERIQMKKSTYYVITFVQNTKRRISNIEEHLIYAVKIPDGS